jgi:hypothetical protein
MTRRENSLTLRRQAFKLLHTYSMKPSMLRPAPARILAAFYREEFVKHQRCLEVQREYYSNGAISDVEAALTRIISQLEHLSVEKDADKVVSGLLRKFNVVTGLSHWSDPTNVH